MSRRKLTKEEKIKAVKSYLEGELGLRETMDKYGVPKSTFSHWIRKYNTLGIEGLGFSKRNRSYSSEVKQLAIEEYRPYGGLLGYPEVLDVLSQPL